MMYSINDSSFLTDDIGMPHQHKHAFVDIAKRKKCVIMIRATGPVCTMLIQEGYDTKSFRIHSKSCDWGPMAGFVMLDPSLNKTRNRVTNYDATRQALTDNPGDGNPQGWTAGTTPLVLSKARVKYLKTNAPSLGIEFDPPANADRNMRITGRVPARLDAKGAPFEFMLNPVNNGTLFGLYIKSYRTAKSAPVTPEAATRRHSSVGELLHASELSLSARSHRRKTMPPSLNVSLVQERLENANFSPHLNIKTDLISGYEELHALTNPVEHRAHKNQHHLNAVTGDYDLFAIWPYVKDYDADGVDFRP